MLALDFLKICYLRFNMQQLKKNNKKYPNRIAQEVFLSKIEDSNNPFDVSYNKFRCVCFYHYEFYIVLFYNIISALLLLPMLLYLNRKKLQVVPKDKHKAVTKNSFSDNSVGIEDIFPLEIKKNYVVQTYIVDIHHIYLDKDANRIIFKAFIKHPFSYYYLLILSIKLAKQSTIIHKMNPALICTYVCEREFADPLLTFYASLYDTEYHGFMHGDFMYQIDHAFMQFSCYWVWDEHYVRMFRELRCNQKMVVYRPGKYEMLKVANKNENECEYYATYYFSGETKKTIDTLKEIFDKLKEKGKRCKIRPHPRYSHFKYINTVFKNYYIEDTHNYNLETSLGDTFLVIGLNSTVLSQAYYCGKIVVIDDITDKSSYEVLSEKDYILFNKAQYRLSEILRIVGVIT